MILPRRIRRSIIKIECFARKEDWLNFRTDQKLLRSWRVFKEEIYKHYKVEKPPKGG